MNPLKMITYKGQTFNDLVIIDGSILLQSLHTDVIFEGAYTKIVADLKAEFYKQNLYGMAEDYVLEYETESMLEFIKTHEGTVIDNRPTLN